MLIESNKDGQGFHLKFANGYTLSVQWRKLNYCIPGESVEIAAWHESGKRFRFGTMNDTIVPYVQHEKLPYYIKLVSELPA